MALFDLFFFSSRRRHTRCLSDWSSDVCSSDLVSRLNHGIDVGGKSIGKPTGFVIGVGANPYARSEERRVGKKCRCRWWPYQYKKTKINKAASYYKQDRRC